MTRASDLRAPRSRLESSSCQLALFNEGCEWWITCSDCLCLQYNGKFGLEELVLALQVDLSVVVC